MDARYETSRLQTCEGGIRGANEEGGEEGLIKSEPERADHCFLAIPVTRALPNPPVATTISCEPPSVITNESEVAFPFEF